MIRYSLTFMQLDNIQSMGGKARAESLSPKIRSEIAKKAAEARWNLPSASHEGELRFPDDISIPCYVLEDGRRLLSSRSLQTATLMSDNKASGEKVARTLATNWFKSLVNNKLEAALTNPIKFIYKGTVIYGYPAETLTALCKALVNAQAEFTTTLQLRMVKRAAVLLGAFAEVGLVALIDEATGYQNERAKNALAEILEKFIAKELRPWTRTFPLEFYKQIFRLKEWPFDPSTMKSPRVLGKYTNNIVYDRIAPGVLKELREKNPIVDGRRKHKHFQWLTGEIGHPKLMAHLEGAKILMRESNSWEEFMQKLDRHYPVYEATELGFEVQVV